LGKNRAAIGVNAPANLVAIIDERADSLGLTRSRFAAMILEWWEARGCPPVSPADEAVQLLKRGKGGPKR